MQKEKKTALTLAASLEVLGCKWKNIGKTKPAKGSRELKNPKLAQRLALDTTFTTKVRDSWGIKDLRADDYILVVSKGDGFYYQPDIGGNIACVRELLAAKANVSPKGGKTALEYAQKKNAWAIVALLEEHTSSASTSGTG